MSLRSRKSDLPTHVSYRILGTAMAERKWVKGETCPCVSCTDNFNKLMELLYAKCVADECPQRVDDYANGWRQCDNCAILTSKCNARDQDGNPVVHTEIGEGAERVPVLLQKLLCGCARLLEQCDECRLRRANNTAKPVGGHPVTDYAHLSETDQAPKQFQPSNKWGNAS